MARQSLYKPEYAERVTEFLAGGHSMQAFCGHIGHRYETVRSWRKQHDEFDEACQVAVCLAIRFWETRLMSETLSGPQITAAIFALKSRSEEWRERIEHTGKDGGPIQTQDMTDTEVARRVAFLLAKAGKAEPEAA